jgi:hypothetical protein
VHLWKKCVILTALGFFGFGPSVHSEIPLFTGWLTDGDGVSEYHGVYLEMAKQGFYPAMIDARAHDHHSEYRAVYLPLPKKPYAWRSWHGLDVEGYLEAVQEVAGLDYELKTWSFFFDHYGQIRFNVTWLKPPAAFRNNPWWIDRDGMMQKLKQ